MKRLFLRLPCVAVFATILTLPIANLQADVILPEVISDNMVLQKDIPLKIWGWAAGGEEVPSR